MADKYIGPRGGRPVEKRKTKVARVTKVSAETVTLPADDYYRLRMMAEAADEMAPCEKCNAWLDLTDENVMSGEVNCCMWYATGDDRFRATCKDHRAELENGYVEWAKARFPITAER